MTTQTRRDFIRTTSAAVLAGTLLPGAGAADSPRSHFQIGLATYSFLRTFRAGKLKAYDFPRPAREDFDIGLLDYKQTILGVPSLWLVDRLNRECEKYHSHIDYLLSGNEGQLAARDLGCTAVRVDWHGPDTGSGTIKDQAHVSAVIERSVPVFKEICARADHYGLGIRLENHGGISGYPDVLLELIDKVGAPNLKTFIDFGNFPRDLDKYAAVDQMMPSVDMVSAKCYDFNEKGEETHTDFERMFEIIFDKHHFKGNVHIEWEGKRMSDHDGVAACLALLKKLRGDRVG